MQKEDDETRSAQYELRSTATADILVVQLQLLKKNEPLVTTDHNCTGRSCQVHIRVWLSDIGLLALLGSDEHISMYGIIQQT